MYLFPGFRRSPVTTASTAELINFSMDEILGIIHRLVGAAKVEIVHSHGHELKYSNEFNQKDFSRIAQNASFLPTLSDKYWIKDAGNVKYIISSIAKAHHHKQFAFLAIFDLNKTTQINHYT